MTEVNKDAVRLLVAALRSGEFEQARGSLVRQSPQSDDVTQVAETRYCCLGVGTEVCIRETDLAETAQLKLITHDPIGSVYGSPEYRYTFKGRSGDNDFIERAGAHLPEPVQKWFGFEYANPRLTVPRAVIMEIADGGDDGSDEARSYLARDNVEFYVSAADCNDDLCMTFAQIADAFERTYLTD